MEEDLRDLVWIGSNLLCRWNPFFFGAFKSSICWKHFFPNLTVSKPREYSPFCLLWTTK